MTVYRDPEVRFRGNISTAIPPLKLIINTKITYGCLVHALVYDLKLKKMGSSKDHFLDFRVLLPRSQKYFREYLCENKNIFENIF